MTEPNIGFVVFIVVLTFVLPSVVATAICYSVASTDERLAIRGWRVRLPSR